MFGFLCLKLSTNVSTPVPVPLFNIVLSTVIWDLRGNIFVSHPASPGSLPGRVSFRRWGFFRGFYSTVRQMSGKLRPHLFPDIIGHHIHKKSIHYGANDLWCKRVLKPIYIYILYSTVIWKCYFIGTGNLGTVPTKEQLRPFLLNSDSESVDHHTQGILQRASPDRNLQAS